MGIELAYHTAEWLNQSGGKSLLDLGCGCGNLAAGLIINLADLGALGVTLIDHNADALYWAKSNVAAAFHARNFQAGINSIKTSLANWLDSEIREGSRYDAVIWNPPYAFEGQVFRNPHPEAHLAPRTAIYAGADGFDAYREVFPNIDKVLTSTGKAFIRMPRIQRRFDQVVSILREAQPRAKISSINLGADSSDRRTRHYGRAIVVIIR